MEKSLGSAEKPKTLIQLGNGEAISPRPQPDAAVEGWRQRESAVLKVAEIGRKDGAGPPLSQERYESLIIL